MTATTLRRRGRSPIAQATRERFRDWWQARVPRSDTLLLTQRNIYILPTPAGLMFAATLVVLLLASINYQLNLGYVLTFLLAGSGVVSMHVTHNTLRTLTLRLRTPAAVFAGEPALLEAVLTSPDDARFGIGLKLADADNSTLTWIDVPAQGQASAQVSFVPAQRGLHVLPTLSIETRFPLGLFRAWAIWRPASQLLVFPAPERPGAPLPPARAVSGGMARGRSTQGGEVEGVRSYRRGDPLKLVYWKKAAKTLASGGDLVSRDTASAVHQQLWLDWQACAGLDPEARLSRLAAWVVAAQRAGAEYGLGLPGRSIEPGEGEAHRRRCLEALALWR
ncbi:DUF58 domain-containing protein [uncultured Piscinibacter sp.]|uniref:DUF58 domain-containing protein n=1 Tax=uncultured Piscinibacter sp. TaxID=1131835 RepID=UPI002606D8C5|nr:DUF58 domain-containing protein [uncultured Piscinibacter sp.]